MKELVTTSKKIKHLQKKLRNMATVNEAQCKIRSYYYLYFTYLLQNCTFILSLDSFAAAL